MFELYHTLKDWHECGDLRGHLRAWWQTVIAGWLVRIANHARWQDVTTDLVKDAADRRRLS